MDDRELARLAAAPLFAGAELSGLRTFFATAPHRIQRFQAGQVVLLAGCSYDELRVILEGEASAEMGNDQGRTVLVETLRAPEAVAAAVLFSPQRRLPVSLVARTDLSLVSIPRGVLLELLCKFPPVLEALLGDMGRRLSFLAEKYRAVSFTNLRGRVADWLLGRAIRLEDGGLEARLDGSKERLAAVFGVARPSLSREFGELERRGLIQVEGRRIRILDPEGLRQLRS